MADITSTSFDGKVVPHEVVKSVLNAGLSGAPVFNALTRRPTRNGSVVFPTSDPSGFDWISELGQIPAVDPDDSAAVVSPAKIAGLLLLSNESIGDADFPIADELGRLIADGMAAKADTDMVYGDSGNPAAPVGIMDALNLASGSTLRAAVVDGCAQIMGNGGSPTTVLLSPTLWADEMERREATQTATGPLFADLGLNLNVTVAATLADTDALVLDKSGCFGLIRSDYSIEASQEAAQAWTHDGVSLRVKARLAVAIPTPTKHARAVTVGS